LGGHNLPWKGPNLAAPGTTYNLNNAGAFGRWVQAAAFDAAG
jgi:hypothetical protein